MVDIVNAYNTREGVVLCLRTSKETWKKLLDCVEQEHKLSLPARRSVSRMLPTASKSAPPETPANLVDAIAEESPTSSGSTASSSVLPPLNLTFTPGGGGEFDVIESSPIEDDLPPFVESIVGSQERGPEFPKELSDFAFRASTGVTDALGLSSIGRLALPGASKNAPSLIRRGVTPSRAMAHMARKSVPALHVDLAAPFLGTGTKLSKRVQQALKDEADSILAGGRFAVFDPTSRAERSRLLRSQLEELDVAQGRAVARVTSGEESPAVARKAKPVVEAFHDVRKRIEQNLLILDLELDPEEDPFA